MSNEFIPNKKINNYLDSNKYGFYIFKINYSDNYEKNY